MYLNKKVKKIGSSIAAAIFVGIVVLFPIKGLAASEADPNVSAAQETTVAAVPISEIIPAPEAIPEAVTPEAIPSTGVEAPAVVSTEGITVPSENPAANIVTPSADPAVPTPVPDVSGASTSGEMMQASGSAADSQPEMAQQETNALPLLVVLIGLVIIVVVIVAVSTAVSSAAVAVDDEEE